MTETAVTMRDRAEQIVKSIVRIISRFVRWLTLLRIAGTVLLVLAILVGIFGYLNERELLYLAETTRQILKYLSANVSTELASLAITILFVDALYECREREREKRRLILQMGSPDNAFAVEAVRALQSHGWLHDGSLKGANLGRANLQEAHLGRANLQEAVLLDANLQKADLVLANFQGAFLFGACLQEALLWGANLKMANLEGANLQEADLMGAVFQRTILVGAKLQGANLMNTTNLQEANLTKAEYNNATRWPEGFTPPPGAVNVDAETNVED